jgi:F0F1-type ATP synthase delta subunit
MNHKLSNRSISGYLSDQTDASIGAVNSSVIRIIAAYAIESNSIGNLESIINDYERSLLNKDILIVSLVSSEQLDDSNKKALEDKLCKYYNVSKILFREIINKNIIGGFKAITPDAEIDGTINKGLTLLRRMKI